MNALLARLGRPDDLPILGLLILFPLALGAMLALGLSGDRRRARGAGPPGAGLPGTVSVWPQLLKRELAAALALLAALFLWSLLADAPLEGPADPVEMSNPAKAPWYFLGLQELLVYFDPWIAGVLLPLLLVFGLAALPYLDPDPGGNGYYTVRERPLALVLFLSGFALWCLLIVVGTFCRGPGWAWFWPWEQWDTVRASLTTELVSLPELLGAPDGPPAFFVGLALAAGWFALWALLLALLLGRREKSRRPGRGAFLVTAFLLAAMLGVVAKIFLRLLLDVSYVVVVPWLERSNI